MIVFIVHAEGLQCRWVPGAAGSSIAQIRLISGCFFIRLHQARTYLLVIIDVPYTKRFFCQTLTGIADVI